MKNVIIHSDVIDGLNTIPDNSVHLIITSPPYNLSIEYSDYQDNMSQSEYLDWMNSVWQECNRVLVSGGRLCINMGENKRQNIYSPVHSEFIQQCVKLEMLYRGTIIWNKNNAANHTAWGSWNSPSNPHIVPRHEYIIIFSKDDYLLPGEKSKSDMTPDGKEFMECTRSVWSFKTESKKRIGHPAPFPVELPYRLIKFYSYQDNIILDPFAGSGTTGIAALKTNRNFILIDNSKEYIDLIYERIKEEFSSNLLYNMPSINFKSI